MAGASQSGASWALILGVSSGTGAAIARALAADPGYAIAGFHRGNHPEDAAQLAGELTAARVPARLFVGEAGTFDGVERGAADLATAIPPRSVKFFVHSIANASIGQFTSGGDDQFVRRQFEKTFESMAHSFVYWTQELLRRDLFAPGARLLALTNSLHDSILRQCGMVLASKAALEAYVRHLAWELGPRGYRVNILKFPTVMTVAAKKVYVTQAQQSLEDTHRRIIPAGRMCTIDEVGRFVSLLPPAQFQLAEIENKLRSSGVYVPLAHVAWSQTASAWGTRAGFALQKLGVDVPGLTGTVFLERGQFLHLGMALSYAPADPPAGLGAGPGTTFTMNQSRRIRFYERNYYDHPAFGVIALVTPAQGTRPPGR